VTTYEQQESIEQRKSYPRGPNLQGEPGVSGSILTTTSSGLPGTLLQNVHLGAFTGETQIEVDSALTALQEVPNTSLYKKKFLESGEDNEGMASYVPSIMEQV